MLVKRYGCDVCYTPMIHSRIFAEKPNTRSSFFSTVPEERPVVAQFCSNDPDYFVTAAKLLQDKVDAIDLNLGCPQRIAKHGNYGAYLLESPETILPLVRAASKELDIPIFCKIRLVNLHTLQDTVDLALALQEAGCKLLTVHGRTKEMRGSNTGVADLAAIRAVKEALDIPVIANGNVRSYAEYEKCLEETGCDGVMSALGLLANPMLFDPVRGNSYSEKDRLEILFEYLAVCEQYPPNNLSQVRGHVFYIIGEMLNKHTDLRQLFAGEVTLKTAGANGKVIDKRRTTRKQRRAKARHQMINEMKRNVLGEEETEFVPEPAPASSVVSVDVLAAELAEHGLDKAVKPHSEYATDEAAPLSRLDHINHVLRVYKDAATVLLLRVQSGIKYEEAEDIKTLRKLRAVRTLKDGQDAVEVMPDLFG